MGQIPVCEGCCERGCAADCAVVRCCPDCEVTTEIEAVERGGGGMPTWAKWVGGF